MTVFNKSLMAGLDVLQRTDKASWFKYRGGSTLVFWRWNSFIVTMRDGFKNYFIRERLRDSPQKLSIQYPPRYCKLKELHEEKLEQIISANHVEPGYCHWDICFLMCLRGTIAFA